MTNQCNCDQVLALRAELLEMCEAVERATRKVLRQLQPGDATQAVNVLRAQAQEVKARLNDE